MKFENLDYNSPTPLYLQVTDIILRKIKNKEIRIGEKIPPQEELRKMFNVSIDTVKEALSHLTREGYLSRRPSYGTFVINDEPKEKAGLKTHSEIRLLVCPYKENNSLQSKNYAHIYFEKIIKGIEERVSETGACLVYSKLNGDGLSIQGRENNIAGFILAGYITPEIVRMVAKTEIPFVCIGDVNGKIKAEEASDIIAVDDFKSTYLAARYLLELGHRRILFLYNTLEYQWHREELRGYKEAFREAGVACDDGLLVKLEETGLNGGYLTVKKVLEESKSFTGIVNLNDALNNGILKALKEKGMGVPEDVSIVGLGCMPELTAITSVSYDLEEMGRKAAERIIIRAKNPELKPARIILPSKLSINDSTRKMEGAYA